MTRKPRTPVTGCRQGISCLTAVGKHRYWSVAWGESACPLPTSCPPPLGSRPVENSSTGLQPIISQPFGIGDRPKVDNNVNSSYRICPYPAWPSIFTRYSPSFTKVSCQRIDFYQILTFFDQSILLGHRFLPNIYLLFTKYLPAVYPAVYFVDLNFYFGVVS